MEPSPERKVIFRNRRRRRQRKITRDQVAKHVTERIDSTHPKMRLVEEASINTRKRSRTPSTDILSVDDEEDDQDTKMPKNKKNYRRQSNTRMRIGKGATRNRVRDSRPQICDESAGADTTPFM